MRLELENKDVDSLWKYKNEQAEVHKQSKTVMETKKLAAVKNLDLQLHRMMNSHGKVMLMGMRA